MKKIYKEQKHTLYEIQKMTGLNKYTLYKYANNISNAENMRFDTLCKIAYVEGLEPTELLRKIKDFQNIKKR